MRFTRNRRKWKINKPINVIKEAWEDNADPSEALNVTDAFGAWMGAFGQLSLYDLRISENRDTPVGYYRKPEWKEKRDLPDSVTNFVNRSKRVIVDEENAWIYKDTGDTTYYPIDPESREFTKVKVPIKITKRWNEPIRIPNPNKNIIDE